MAKRKSGREQHWIVERPAANGTTRYQTRWHEGTTRRSKTFATREKALRHLEAINHQLQRGTYPPVTDATVTDLVLEHVVQGPITLDLTANYRVFDNHIRDALGSFHTDRLTRAMVQRWITSMVAAGTGAGTIKKARPILSAAFSEAVALDVGSRNPVGR